MFSRAKPSNFQVPRKIGHTSIFWHKYFIIHVVGLAELPNNGFAWKNVTFYAVSTHAPTTLTYFQGIRTPLTPHDIRPWLRGEGGQRRSAVVSAKTAAGSNICHAIFSWWPYWWQTSKYRPVGIYSGQVQGRRHLGTNRGPWRRCGGNS